MGRRLPWLVALPLIVAGSFAAHAVGYLLGPPDAHGEPGAHPEAVREGASVVPLSLGLVCAFVLVICVATLLGRARGRRGGVSPWCFFVLPPVGFALAELFERIASAETFPFDASLEPSFLLGLALQLPFAILAVVVARLLLAVAARVLRALADDASRSAGARYRPSFPAAVSVDLPRVPVLAAGHAGRGPPVGIY